MRKKYFLFICSTLLILIKSISAFGQLSVNSASTIYTIDFSTTLSGINNGAYTGSGFQPTPTGGQLDSDGWAVTGMSDGALTFGGTQTTATTDYTRGTTNIAVSTGGFYAYTGAPHSAANPAFLIQPVGADWTPGTLTLKILNNTGSTITSFDISYNLFVRNDQARANSFNFSYSTDDITYTAVAGLDYTSIEAADGLGYVQVGTSPSRSTTISSLAIANGANFYIRWNGNDVSGTGSVDEFALDDIKVTGFTTCLLAAEPTTDATGISFSGIGCNGMTLSWAAGNGANRMVVAKASSAVAGTPTDQTVYTANANFGSGSTIAAGEYVVYKGTGNTFTVFGLAASTTYYFKVFEFNGNACEENYFTAVSPASGNQATIACTQCPQLTGALINSCATPCSEGDNELLFLNSGSYFIPVSATNIVVKYDPSPTNPATTTYTDALTTNAAYINTLNTNAGCGTLFYDAMATEKIPPNTEFIVMRSTACYGYNFSSFCSSGPIYVVFSTDVSWTTSGNFSNSCAPLRYFRTDFSTFAPGCITDYTYDPCLLTLQGDGDAISWPNGGGAANNYFNDNCNPPVNVLPISLIEFDAIYDNKTVQLIWSTASEINNDYFTIERTTDGLTFENINMIEGAGNSNQVVNYQSLDPKPESGLSYYRLKQTDYDGKFSYSNLVAVHVETRPVLEILNLLPVHPEIQLTLSSNSNHPVSVKITDILGKVIYNKEVINNEKYNSININTRSLNTGMYILHISNGNESISRKFAFIKS